MVDIGEMYDVKKVRSIYKKGDDGTTSLVSGARVPKSDDRIDLYGDLDELNSLLGHALAAMTKTDWLPITKNLKVFKKIFLSWAQTWHCEPENREKFKLPQLDAEVVETLERSIDFFDSSLPKLTSFILPGGGEASTRIHLCRTFVRRLERKCASYQQHVEALPENYLTYLNRLSDYFFVLARYLNFSEQINEVKWP